MSTAEALVRLAGASAGALLLVLLLKLALTGRLVSRWPLIPPIARRCARSAYVTAVLSALVGTLPARPILPAGVSGPVRHGLQIALIAAVTWLLVAAVNAGAGVLINRWVTVEGERNRHARRLRTQVMLLRRTVDAIIVVVAIATMLFTFPQVRLFGASLLASAGIIGIVAGIAAQSTLGNLFAGLQLAFSDALRIDDVVVIDGEWGRIEELTLTYVVVRSWDERRLILPVAYFTQHPFENWTRDGSRVIGTVLLYVDWSVPVPELRAKLHDILRDHPLWDRREWVLQVTDVTPNGLVQLRALMSAADSASAWDLRCHTRERLIEYLREHHPQALPRVRAEIGSPATGAGTAAAPS
jgi:small-conductance mechanosensitive channel